MTGTPGQLPMFIVNPAINDQPPATTTTNHPGDAPTCPSCRLRPAAWNTSRGQYARYCTSAHCSNHQRLCTWCGTTYERSAPGAGTKYCSDQCKAAGYKATANPTKRRTQPVACANCQHPITGTKPRADICANCRGRYSSQIGHHHLDTETALRLINATHCDCCGDKLTRTHDRHKGVLDHDHGCCPGLTSCGNCIRGIICGECNTKAGAIEANPARFQAILRYLDRPST